MKDEILRSTRGLRLTLLAVWLSICLALAFKAARADDAPTDLPREQPISATGFVYCTGSQKLIVGVVITYPSGKVVRFSKDNMHGLSLPDLVKYADSVENSAIYGAGACDSTTT